MIVSKYHWFILAVNSSVSFLSKHRSDVDPWAICFSDNRLIGMLCDVKPDYFTEKWLGIGIVSNVYIDLAFEI